jgi:heme exporter protein D
MRVATTFAKSIADNRNLLRQVEQLEEQRAREAREQQQHQNG